MTANTHEAKIHELRARARQASAIRQYGELQVPRAWVREMSRPNGARWVRMVSLAIDPITVKPAILVTDMARMSNGGYLYTANEEIHSGKVHWEHFRTSLTRITADCKEVAFPEMEQQAQEILETSAIRATRMPFNLSHGIRRNRNAGSMTPFAIAL